jgi:hypothetical protein
MESPERESERATEWNRQLARRVVRWKRLRVTIATLLAVAGVTTAFFDSTSVWSGPCLIASFLAYLLYLDARDQLREVKARRWNRLTPRIAGVTGARGKDAAQAPSSQ